jgi:hypothetical protein
MKSLILDFLRRWRWLLVILLLITAASSIAGLPAILAPAAVVALLLDAQRGVFRAVRPLPISRLDQARAWWFIGVPLLPLLSVPMLVLGILLFPQFHPNTHSTKLFPITAAAMEAVLTKESLPNAMSGSHVQKAERYLPAHPRKPDTGPPALWFAAAVQVWVALGYAGFCFFLMQWMPTRQAENLKEHVQYAVFGLLWGLSMPGIAFLLPNLPRSSGAIVAWHWAVFAAVPVFVALSYFSAAELLRRRMFVTTTKTKPQASAQPFSPSNGLAGIPLYVVNFAGRTVMMVALIACVQMLVLQWISRGNHLGSQSAAGMQASLMGMMFGTFIAEQVGMRALRVLPLSTPKLALLLALIPWTGALAGAVVSTVVCGAGDPALSAGMNLLAQSLALCGWVTLVLAINLHISASWRLFAVILLSIIPSMALQFAAKYTELITAAGLAAGIAGFVLLIRGLRKSSAFYRPRGFFGVVAGEPTAVR